MFKGKGKGMLGLSPSSQERHVAEILGAMFGCIHIKAGVWSADSSKINFNREMAFRLEQGRRRVKKNKKLNWQRLRKVSGE